MKNFLDKIQSTQETKDELSNAHLNVFTKGVDLVAISVKTTGAISAKTHHEFYSKTVSKLDESGFNLESFSFETDHKYDSIAIYENILEFIKDKTLEGAKWKFTFEDIGPNYIIKCIDTPFTNSMKAVQADLEAYLNMFNLLDKDLIIDTKSEELGGQIILEQLEEKRNEFVEVSTDKEETIRNGFNEIDFNKEGDQNRVYFQGEVFMFDSKEVRGGATVFNFSIGNNANSVPVNIYDDKDKTPPVKEGEYIRVYGTYRLDSYTNSMVFKTSRDRIQKLNASSFNKIEKDETGLERCEFHVHTKMSMLDGVSEMKDYIKYAEAYNLKSITVMDHNSAQGYPSAYEAGKNSDVTVNYGVEVEVYDDLSTNIVINPEDRELLDAEYVFFDLETTSLFPMADEIIEFGAVKYKNNNVIDRLQMFIKPKRPITENITEITNITNADVQFAASIEEKIGEIKDWIGDAILVAHNADFDYKFLNKAYRDNGLGEIENPIIDSMKLSWLIHPKSRGHSLMYLCKNEDTVYDPAAAHRADYDAEVLSKAFDRLLQKLLRMEIRNLNTLNDKTHELTKYFFPNEITLISKNQKGLRDINKIVSMANVDYFNTRSKQASLPLSFFFDKHKHHLLDNIMVGSGTDKGFLMDAILNDDMAFLETIIKMYDYLEVSPVNSYGHLIFSQKASSDTIKTLITKVIALGKKFNIPVVATSNAHYADEAHKVYRDIMISASRVGGKRHPLFNYKDQTMPNPDAHLWTTKKMIEHFNEFLPEDITMDIVINNGLKIQEQIEEQKPIHSKLYTPKIPGAEEDLVKSIEDTTRELYGDNPNPIIKERVERELGSIIEHGFSVVYFLSAVAVKKSNDDGYLVGSRGSVGSSLAATLSGITEVNPLAPHYRCPKCKYHEFVEGKSNGFDLEDKPCPKCQSTMKGDGHSIPFETFLGFNADKVPDIDLNFSRENQSSIHTYMKEYLGEDKIFRAGTISTAAFKTAVGYVKNWQELHGKQLSKAQIEWLASKVEGAKRTTGQHPGGLIVIPNEFDVYDFTPINYPGDDAESEWKTTHFDFHSIHDNVLKLDLLGHLDPSSIRMLQILTGVDPKEIPMNDPEVISLFKSNKALKYIEDYTGEKLGIIGLPEFGTNFVRELVREAKPESFGDLVRISGLSHGTNVWSGNAQKLIKDGKASLKEVISVRDDIMTYLISMGVEKSMSFNIMESVRKGKGLTPEWEHEMKQNNVPEWYIESCKKIEYMFPKAHASAYVMMAYRIAWWKINFPLEYYATYFSKRDIEIDLGRVLKGVEEMKKHISEIKSIPFKEKQKKHDDLLETYNIVLEMYSRGISFANIDINKSQASDFTLDKDKNQLIPPFTVIDGVGDSAAAGAVANRPERGYTSIKEFKVKSTLQGKAVDTMKSLGVFEGVSNEKEDTEQLELFV